MDFLFHPQPILAFNISRRTKRKKINCIQHSSGAWHKIKFKEKKNWICWHSFLNSCLTCVSPFYCPIPIEEREEEIITHIFLTDIIPGDIENKQRFPKVKICYKQHLVRYLLNVVMHSTCLSKTIPRRDRSLMLHFNEMKTAILCGSVTACFHEFIEILRAVTFMMSSILKTNFISSSSTFYFDIPW